MSVVAGTNNGTGAPTPSIPAGGFDDRFDLGIGSGTSPAAGIQAVVTTSGSWMVPADISLPLIKVNPQNAAAGALGPWYGVFDATKKTITVYCTGTPAASQSIGTYYVGVEVTG